MREEPIVRKDFSLYGYELLTWQGKFGNNSEALSCLCRRIKQKRERKLKLFINLPPSYVTLMPQDVKELLLELNSITPIVVEILELEPFNPFELPLFPFPYALDDWGTGYSNLEILLKILDLPNFQYVKIDRQIFAPLLRSKEGRSFLRGFLFFLDAKGKTVVFEKVESRSEFNELCFLSPERTLFQGFYVAREIKRICKQGRKENASRGKG